MDAASARCAACGHEAGRRPCPMCHESVAADAVKCPHCRSAIGTIPCPGCREPAPADATVCPRCHTALRAAPVVGSIRAPQKFISPSNPPKSPLLALLLSFVVFCLPIGHFYIGQAIKGLIWLGIVLITGGIGSIVAAVDVYLCAKKLERGDPIGEFEFFPS